MKTQVKKIISAAVSAAMIVSSFSVFAEIDVSDEVMDADRYISIDTAVNLEIPDEEIEASIKSTITPDENVITEIIDEEIMNETDISDMTVWDIPDSLEWNEELFSPLELNVDTSGQCGDNLTWNLDGSTLTISGTGDMYAYPVRSLSSSYRSTAPWSGVSNVIISEGVTSIGAGAFACQSITSITIPDSVKIIGEQSFAGCKSLANIDFGIGLNEIGSFAFQDCTSLTDVIIPDNITIIDSGAFSASGLKNITLPNTITIIEDFTFSKTKIENIIIPDSVISIGNEAFSECRGLDNVVIPDSVTNIDGWAFKLCSSLTNIKLSNRLQKINASVFYQCTKLKTLVVPSSVTEIADLAFLNSDFEYIYIQKPKNSISGSPWAYSSITVIWGSIDIPNIPNQYYTGTAIEPKISITYNDYENPVKTLAEGTDYTVSYENNTAVGTGTVKVNYLGDYAGYNNTGYASIDFEILNGDISMSNIADIPSQTYTGAAIMPSLTVILGDKTLIQGTDYDLSYTNNINVGTATVAIKGKGIFIGSISKTFRITACPMSTVSVDNILSQIYTGSVITPIPIVRYSGKTLVNGIDYTLSYSNNTSVGAGAIKITGKGNFNGITNKTFTILPASIENADVTFPSDISYQGEACMPEPIVVVNGKTLTKDTDYTVSYSNNNGVGTATAAITGKGNYTGSKAVQFEVGPFKPINVTPVSIDDDSLVESRIDGNFVYNGMEHTPQPIFIYHFINPTTGTAIDYDMIEGIDYEIVSYSNNINAGIARVIINGIGTFNGNTTVTFKINSLDVAETEIADIPSAEYCKEDICPEPEIRIGDKILEKDVDYTLEYENNRNRGTASVIITGKGNISGTITKNFEITPRDGSRFTIIVWL